MAKRLGVAIVVLLMSVLLVMPPEPAEAQDRPVRFNGRVQWVAGQVMAVQLDSGLSVSVDLVRVPQDEYAALTASERIVVIGVVTDRNRRVLGRSILRGEDAQAP